MIALNHTRENARRAKQVAAFKETEWLREGRRRAGEPVRRHRSSWAPGPMINDAFFALHVQDLADAEKAAEDSLARAGIVAPTEPSSMSEVAKVLGTPALLTDSKLAFGAAVHAPLIRKPFDPEQFAIYVDKGVYERNPKLGRFFVGAMLAHTHVRSVLGNQYGAHCGWADAFGLAITMPRTVVDAVYDKYGDVTGPELARLCRVPDRLGLLRKRMLLKLDTMPSKTIDLDLEADVAAPVAAE